MTYSATYDADDIAPVAIDILLTGAVLLVSFATLIVLIMIYRWAKKRV